MKINSPNGLHYPITVVELAKQPNDDVKRRAPLFTYFYETEVTEGNKYGDEVKVKKKLPARFESPVEGTLAEWYIKNGSVIERAGLEIAEIEEPCTHETQWGGLCTDCGKDMTQVDYATQERDSDRATVKMTHTSASLLVSRNEALRAEEDSRRRLLGDKKLSLIVDLDQTVIHTTCERTIAEWQADPNNPNYNAVKDVHSFQLADDRMANVPSNWYYVKVRPGTKEFLERVSTMYELHVYTMATRAYAQAIAKIIDPDRRYFADRILSRDENGTDQIKSLHRLFPTNTDMVVIIDDRADVWHYSDNLIRVKAYNFFLGAGDINASFLPKQVELIEPVQQATTTEPPKHQEVSPQEGTPSDTLTDLEQQLLSMSSADKPEVLEQQVKEQEKIIISQQTERPLLQKQLLLDKEDEAREEATAENGEAQPVEQHKQRHSLLHDDDNELEYVETALRRIHRAFYDEYQKKKAGPQVGRIAELKGEKSPKKRNREEFVPDVKVIMPRMKRSVLSGVSVVFSGIIPLGLDIQFSDIALWAKSFGVQVTADIHKQTTHLVANPGRKTNKVKKAARHSLKIVTVHWLYECFSKWERVSEDPYLIEVDPEHGLHASSGDPYEELDDGPLLSGEDDDIEDIGGDVQIDISADKWDSIGDEFDDFMNETDDDNDNDTDNNDTNSDSESVRSDDSAQTTDSQKQSAKKRKRATASTGSASNSEAEDSDSSVKSTGSRLQRKKKRVFERVTSLSNVMTADKSSGLPSPDTTGPEEEQEKGEAEVDEDDDDLEAQMLAELERQSDEDDGE